LHAIDDLHSLYAAAKKLKMSYRAAWGRLKASEDRLGVKLTCSDGQGKGLHLTPEAKELLEKFDKLQRDVDSFLKGYGREFSLSKIKIKTADENKECTYPARVTLPALILLITEEFDVMTAVDMCLHAL
jgi:molybdate transport repressor ModE-like protein